MNRSKGVRLLRVWVLLSNLVLLLNIRAPNSGILLTIVGVVGGSSTASAAPGRRGGKPFWWSLRRVNRVRQRRRLQS